MNITKTLIDLWLGSFHARGEEIISFFVNCSLPRKIFLEEYKKLLPIEQMPEKEKKEMKQYIIEKFPNKTIQEKLEAAKIVYTVGSLL